MKILFSVVLLLLLVILNSCEIAKKPRQIQINKLLSEQQLQKVAEPELLKAKPISIEGQFQIISFNDSLTKLTTVRHTPTKIIFNQNQAFKNLYQIAINIPVANIKTFSHSLIKPTSSVAGLSNNTYTQSNIYSKLATVFLILSLCLIILTFTVFSGLGFNAAGLFLIGAFISLFFCLVFFIIGLAHKGD